VSKLLLCRSNAQDAVEYGQAKLPVQQQFECQPAVAHIMQSARQQALLLDVYTSSAAIASSGLQCKLRATSSCVCLAGLLCLVRMLHLEACFAALWDCWSALGAAE
jgi:hypothetical protein